MLRSRTSLLTATADSAAPHWLDRLAVRLAGRHAYESQHPDAATVGDSAAGPRSGMPLTRRRLIAAGAAFATTLAIDAAPQSLDQAAASGARCADDKFQRCIADAWANYHREQEKGCRGSASGCQDAIFIWVGAAIGAKLMQNTCRKEAAQRNCSSCETCDFSTGYCTSMCRANESCCSGKCIDLKNDSSNCGSCGRACVSPSICCPSMAAPGAPPQGQCVDPGSDFDNCGGCGIVCPSGQICNQGMCITCPGNPACRSY